MSPPERHMFKGLRSPKKKFFSSIQVRERSHQLDVVYFPPRQRKKDASFVDIVRAKKKEKNAVVYGTKRRRVLLKKEMGKSSLILPVVQNLVQVLNGKKQTRLQIGRRWLRRQKKTILLRELSAEGGSVKSNARSSSLQKCSALLLSSLLSLPLSNCNPIYCSKKGNTRAQKDFSTMKAIRKKT